MNTKTAKTNDVRQVEFVHLDGHIHVSDLFPGPIPADRELDCDNCGWIKGQLFEGRDGSWKCDSCKEKQFARSSVTISRC